MLDFKTCDEARRERNPVYDGRFFTAVTTTGIYCRPICPAQPLSRNVRFYLSAAAAERDGFRPCFRCRPETAPFSPAWNGTRTTVGRALKLIDAGALDDGSVEQLAGKLGVGVRHLSRLFQAHLGTSPTAVARTRRLQRAKRLLDSTGLSMTEIAARSGFSSIRSFNATFVEVYGRPPSAVRVGRKRAPFRQRDGRAIGAG
ncbi:MAG: helix-turn-helix domain-containing protein [Xanthobacteraceae bacterium]|nr:helix-turn-helix domain-containing protein [Xanthobacteraceae bacterium]